MMLGIKFAGVTGTDLSGHWIWTLDFETSYKTYYYWIIGSVNQN
jgi:hypothetical protein